MNIFNHYRIKQVKGVKCTSFMIQHKFLGLFWYKAFTNTIKTYKEAEDIIKILNGEYLK